MCAERCGRSRVIRAIIVSLRPAQQGMLPEVTADSRPSDWSSPPSAVSSSDANRARLRYRAVGGVLGSGGFSAASALPSGRKGSAACRASSCWSATSNGEA